MDKQKQIEEMRFKVIDNNTGKEADICEIALNEDWAKDLIYCDMQGFAILDDGNLVLLDECGKYVYCPNGRFSVIPENAVVLTEEELTERDYERYNLGYETHRQESQKREDYIETLSYHINDLENALLIVRKETAEKFARLVEFHSVATMKDGREYFTISALGLKEILHEEFGIPYDEICKEITEKGV